MRALLLVLVAVLVVPLTHAGDCIPSTSPAELCLTEFTTVCASGDVDGRYDVISDCKLVMVWGHQCIAGLQRDDDIVDDTCRGMIRPDKLIF